MITLVYSADGSKLIAVYKDGKLAKQATGGMTEGDLLKLFGYHGKAVLDSDFDSDTSTIPLILGDVSKYQSYDF
jgi:hypothetical protein